MSEPHSVPVLYDSWDRWRADRVRDCAETPPPVAPADVSFCAVCWGQGRIWTNARNGEGLIPTMCDHCAGEGVVRSER